MKIFVDTSIWIGYFNKGLYNNLEELIENDLVIINDIILTELIPFLYNIKATSVIGIMLSLPKNKLNINWESLIDLQKENLAQGVNKVGIPDLIICQNVMENNQTLWTNDKHFYLMQKFLNLDLFT
jgi:predicted nucleic acid-binding protein